MQSMHSCLSILPSTTHTCTHSASKGILSALHAISITAAVVATVVAVFIQAVAVAYHWFKAQSYVFP
jgi:uncharacterized membrane protein